VPTTTRSLMVIVYSILALAGVIFIVDPVASIKDALYGTGLAFIWGLFYLVGGATSALGVIVRLLRGSLLATWYFELAGLALLVFASLAYSVALAQLAVSIDEMGVLGTSLVVLALATSLSLRIAEMIQLVQNLRRIESRFKDTGSGDRE
jgi:hypothetical protein